MRCLVQRVSKASVTVGGQIVGQTGAGVLILACAMDTDTDANAAQMARKIAKMRIFKDDGGKMNWSVLDVAGSALIVSQFTLAADTSRGNRPGFSAAARPDKGKRLFDLFCASVADFGIKVETGTFGADMQVELVNDGPVTIWLDK